MSDSETSVEQLLRQTEALSETPELAPLASGIFDHAQYLLDDDDNLTRAGNLTGEAKGRLRKRAEELLGLTETTDLLDD